MNITVSVIPGLKLGIEYIDTETAEAMEIQWGIVVDALLFRFFLFP